VNVKSPTNARLVKPYLNFCFHSHSKIIRLKSFWCFSILLG